jgi:hypothetical protein
MRRLAYIAWAPGIGEPLLIGRWRPDFRRVHFTFKNCRDLPLQPRKRVEAAASDSQCIANQQDNGALCHFVPCCLQRSAAHVVNRWYRHRCLIDACRRYTGARVSKIRTRALVLGLTSLLEMFCETSMEGSTMSTAEIMAATPRNSVYKLIQWQVETEDVGKDSVNVDLSRKDLKRVRDFHKSTGNWPRAFMCLVPNGATLGSTCAWLKTQTLEMSVERLASLNKRYFDKSPLNAKMRPTCLTLQSLRDATYDESNGTKAETTDSPHLQGPKSAKDERTEGPNSRTRKIKYTVCGTCGEQVYLTASGQVSHTSRFLDTQCDSR